jgi:hypothetical protein
MRTEQSFINPYDRILVLEALAVADPDHRDATESALERCEQSFPVQI